MQSLVTIFFIKEYQYLFFKVVNILLDVNWAKVFQQKSYSSCNDSEPNKTIEINGKYSQMHFLKYFLII
jgi:hypothetical protein